MTSAARELRSARFFEKAAELFAGKTADERGKHNLHYIDVPVRLADGRLPPEPEEQQTAKYTNPVHFLTGIKTGDMQDVGHRLAEPPFVTLVVGQYGLGKTELMFRLGHHMEISFTKVLAINLGMCRNRASKLDSDSSPEVIVDVLFGRILDLAGIDRSYVMEELQPQIRRGNVILILDGLDELISAQRQHNRFFADLMRFLSGGDPEEDAYFRVIVTMRLEYLSGVTTSSDASDLAKLIRREAGGVAVSVYFLVLDYVGDEGLKTYLAIRLPDLPDAFEKIRLHDRLLDMIRRPLLLRMFCDLAEILAPQIGELLTKLMEIESPAILLERFVAAAALDDDLSHSQQNVSDFTWDSEKLGAKTLDLYRNGRQELTVDDIRSFLKLREAVKAPIKESHETPREVIEKLSTSEVLKGIHKCPFLRQDVVTEDTGTEVARFAHRVFYEYFTAKAMAEDLNNASADKIQRRERAFDELVLNVDMRKFLRGMFPKDVWYAQTRKSYGLDDLEEWPVRPSAEEFDELNEKRSTLLDAMTDPVRMKEPAVLERYSAAVKWFLDQESRWLHPRYRTPNYEAIAVYLWYRRFYPDAQQISRDLEAILEKRLDLLVTELDDPKTNLRKAKTLLLERILDIGRRFWYQWAKTYAGRRGEVLGLIAAEEADVANRIGKIFDDIHSAQF
ncbi:MAG: hypothetical protein WB973_13875 [Thermoanaerobaculia bacterium]